jgi:toxin ParE1/3/4
MDRVNADWLNEATRELDSLYEFVAKSNPKAARRLLRAILAAVDQVSQFPTSGRPGEVSGTREVIVSGTPFRVVYRVQANRVVVLRVFHSSRNPVDLLR